MSTLQYTEKDAMTQLEQGCELGKKAQLTVIADATIALLLATNDKQAKQLYSDAVQAIINSGVYAKSNAYELATVARRVIHYRGKDALAIINGEATLKAARNALIDLLQSFTDDGTIARSDKAAPNGRWMLPLLPLMPKDEAKHAAKSEALAAEKAAQVSEVPSNAPLSEDSEKTVLSRTNELLAKLERLASYDSDETYNEAAKQLARVFIAAMSEEQVEVPDALKPLHSMVQYGINRLVDSGDATRKAA